MLGTLMKYEFKAIGRILLPLYGAWIIVAAMLGLSLRSDGVSDPNTFMIVMTAVLFAFITVSAVVITLIILIQRFYKNLLGNEGYLMFALPVSTGNHLTNKIVSGAAWTVIGGIAAILSGCAIIISIEGFPSFFDEVSFIVGDFKIMIDREPTSILLILEVLLILIVGSAEAVAEIYAAISIGHLWNNHRILGAILAYIGIGMIEGIVASAFSFLDSLGVFNWAENIFYNLSYIAQSHVMLIFALLLAAAMLAIYWFVSWIVLSRKLNLE